MKLCFCKNCGSNLHRSKDCPHPIISLGVICYKIDKSIIQKKMDENYIKIDRYNSNHLSNLSKINVYRKKIKFLLVRRKHTYNFIDFVRGKYEFDDVRLIQLFKLMSPEEIVVIGSYPFKKIWEYLWRDTSWLKSYEKEYKDAKTKFEKLKVFNNGVTFKFLTTEIIPDYSEPEWGFPKGRRDFLEDNITCATREFNEETTLTNNEFQVMKQVLPINENYIGTNKLSYQHIYYLAKYTGRNKKIIIDENDPEIGEIGWFTLDESLELFRNYYSERMNLLQKIYLFILNTIQ